MTGSIEGALPIGSMYQELLKEQVVPDDQYDRNRKNVFWFNDAANKLNRFLTRIGEDVTSFPSDCETLLRTGDSQVDIDFDTITNAMTPSQRNNTAQVILGIRGIASEKGFRYSSSLITSREHKELGSSGYGGIYEATDSDIPIPLLRARLIAEGKLLDSGLILEPSNNFTVEEVDKARRLAGMTSLDLATGRVTNQIDPEAASDSYYFLSSEKKIEIKQREEELLKIAEIISESSLAEHASTITIIEDLVDYTNGVLTTPQLKLRYEEVLSHVSTKYPLDLDPNIRECKKIASATGKWDRILTPQEILLRSNGSVDEHYLASPYTPLAIQDGALAEDILKLRRGEQSMTIDTTLLGYPRPLSFRLEELDKTGNTIKSPSFFDEYEETVIDDEQAQSRYGEGITFPFARPEDWFYGDEGKVL